MVFRSSQATRPYIETSREGYGNTSYSQLPNRAPANRTIKPSRGGKAAGTRVTFTTTWRDADGWYDLAQLQLHVGKTKAQRNNCRVTYDVQTNKLYLRNNAGNRWTGGRAPGSASVLRNRQCKLDCRRTTVVKSGTTVRVKWNLIFDRSFRGLKRTYLQATDVQGGKAAWQKKGTWRIR
jgi:hypothetical protein